MNRITTAGTVRKEKDNEIIEAVEYYEVRIPESDRKPETLNYENGSCIVAQKREDSTKKGNIRIFAPLKWYPRWISLKHVIPSKQCEKAHQIAGEMYEGVSKEYDRTQMKDHSDATEFSDILTRWVEKRLDRRISFYTTYDEKKGDFCGGYCRPLKLSRESLIKNHDLISESAYEAHYALEKKANDKKSEWNRKQEFISNLHIAVFGVQIVFYYIPGSCHNVQWHFKHKKNGWVITTIKETTD